MFLRLFSVEIGHVLQSCHMNNKVLVSIGGARSGFRCERRGYLIYRAAGVSVRSGRNVTWLNVFPSPC